MATGCAGDLDPVVPDRRAQAGEIAERRGGGATDRTVQLRTKPAIQRQKLGAVDHVTDTAPSRRTSPAAALASAPGAASGTTWLGTRWPALPSRAPSVDRSAVDDDDTSPSRRRARARDESPTIPAPITITSPWSIGAVLVRSVFAQCLTVTLLVTSTVFHGCLPALMTPCDADGRPTFDALVATAERLMAAGMTGVVYCGSMGDWPLLSGEQRRRGVERLVAAGVPVVVGTGAPSPAEAAAHAAHAESVGAAGLMVIPRVLSRGSSPAAQRAHFAGVLGAAPQSAERHLQQPVLRLRDAGRLVLRPPRRVPQPRRLQGVRRSSIALVRRRAHHVGGDDLALVVGVDTEVVHGIVDCGAIGVITGIGNVLPDVVLRLIELCRAAVDGDPDSMRLALELERALGPLAAFDEGPDLVLFYKHLAVRAGDTAYEHQIDSTDVADRQPAPLRDGAVRPFSPLVGELGGQPVARFVNLGGFCAVCGTNPAQKSVWHKSRPDGDLRAILLNRWPSGDDSQR